eukprot:4003731-Amphidinium_carterae.1
MKHALCSRAVKHFPSWLGHAGSSYPCHTRRAVHSKRQQDTATWLVQPQDATTAHCSNTCTPWKVTCSTRRILTRRQNCLSNTYPHPSHTGTQPMVVRNDNLQIIGIAASTVDYRLLVSASQPQYRQALRSAVHKVNAQRTPSQSTHHRNNTVDMQDIEACDHLPKTSSLNFTDQADE